MQSFWTPRSISEELLQRTHVTCKRRGNQPKVCEAAHIPIYMKASAFNIHADSISPQSLCAYLIRRASHELAEVIKREFVCLPAEVVLRENSVHVP